MKSTLDFLLEVGCEEIPAGVIEHAVAELQRNLEKYLSTASLLVSPDVRIYAAPRRFAALAEVRRRQPDMSKEVTGPPKSAAFDSVGAPTKAALGFAQKQGVRVSDLEIVKTARGEYLVARQTVPGKSAEEILREVVPASVLQLTFPRTMTWTNAFGPRFIRPIRWIVALLNGHVLRVEIAGVKAGDWSAGHRFLGSARVKLTGSKNYISRLRRNFVLADAAERRRKIEMEIRKICSRGGWRLHPDEDLLNQVTYLNEYPAVLAGDFDEKYLELPEEILITVMRDHQKYFAVEDVHGSLLPHFLAVINVDKDRAGLIREGHERVLRARFADARFFWDADQKTLLADNFPRLAKVTFESRLGSYGDKVARVRVLAGWVSEQWFNSGIPQSRVTAAIRAGELAKCDLVTDMVREFSELQGIVGGLYARAQGEDDDVAWAIYDHYRPLGLGEPLPRNLTGCAVALADKLDSLAGCFAVGAIPSGSSDPFALRRAALGIVRILLERKLPLSLSSAVTAAKRGLEQFPPHRALTSEAESQLLAFLLDRARFVLREKQGFAYDELNAAFASGTDDLVDASQRVAALHAIRTSKNFMPLAVAFKRIRKILEKAGVEGGKEGERMIRLNLFEQNAERDLHAEVVRVAAHAGEFRRVRKYEEALKSIAELRPAVDRFFDEVLVMDERKDVRQNRLALLANLLGEFSTIADFSEMVAE